MTTNKTFKTITYVLLEVYSLNHLPAIFSKIIFTISKWKEHIVVMQGNIYNLKNFYVGVK